MTVPEPPRFAARWLRFDPQQPAHGLLLRRFIAAVVAMILVCGLLALWSASR